MKITIAAIGKASAGCAEMRLAENYLKRLPWSIEIRETEEKKNLPPEKLKEKEAELLLALAPAGSFTIALDEHGKEPNSKNFAALLGKCQNDGFSHITFFIGGAYGHGKLLKSKVNTTLSLGQMTWPHLLVRTMLAEQLYRGYTILTNHPYHKE